MEKTQYQFENISASFDPIPIWFEILAHKNVMYYQKNSRKPIFALAANRHKYGHVTNPAQVHGKTFTWVFVRLAWNHAHRSS